MPPPSGMIPRRTKTWMMRAVLASVAVAAYRQARRSGLSLDQTAASMDAVVESMVTANGDGLTPRDHAHALLAHLPVDLEPARHERRCRRRIGVGPALGSEDRQQFRVARVGFRSAARAETGRRQRSKISDRGRLHLI